MKTFTVNLNGFPVKSFAVETEARKFMLLFSQEQMLQEQKLALIDEAVTKSDLREAKEVLSYIMEK